MTVFDAKTLDVLQSEIVSAQGKESGTDFSSSGMLENAIQLLCDKVQQVLIR